MRFSRRRFCQSALAIGSASVFPNAVVLGQSATSSRAIPSEIRGVKLNGGDTSIEGAAVGELAESLDGQLLISGDFGLTTTSGLPGAVLTTNSSAPNWRSCSAP